MKKESFYLLGGVIGTSFLYSSCTGKPAEVQQPNIILIMTDQQRGDCVGVMGNKGIKTPHMDGLAHDGITFLNGYSSCPSSTPARAALLTGMGPWGNGMLGYGTIATHYEYEMPRMLANNNYYTYAIGKLHYAPQRNLHGFHGALLDESGRVHTQDFESDYRKWFRQQAPTLNPDSTGMGWNEHNGNTYALAEELHPTTWTANEAIKFIREYRKDNPLFLKISFARPHSPYDPPQRFVNMYKDEDIQEPYIGDWCAAYADRPNIRDASFGNFGKEHAIESRKFYYASISFIDEKIGEIINELRRKGIYENSLVVFISDHGDMLGDHHHWRKTYPYEGSTHVPYIVKFPNSTKGVYDKGSKLEQPVELRDILPTFLDAAGADIPNRMNGKSLYTLFKDKNAVWRPYIDMEHANYRDYKNWFALTDGKVKYIYFSSTGEEQLFDISKDKSEIHDLSENIAHASILEQWRNCLKNHLKERDERFIKGNRLQRIDSSIVYSPNYPGPLHEIEF